MKKSEKQSPLCRALFAVSALLILALEVYIALYVHDAWIRPYGGDVLVVILIYCLLRAVLPHKPRFLAGYVFAFAVCVEFLQYANIVALLGLQNSRFFSTLLGTSFSWVDIGCYALGSLANILLNKTT